VLCAGELLALMAGHRGLAMVQLYLEPSLLSGDGTSGSGQLRQPSFNPYVSRPHSAKLRRCFGQLPATQIMQWLAACPARAGPHPP
jgi:hypothetical protein